jgi:hypothetical protein
LIAPGGDRVLSLRRGGMRPGESVVVSLIGEMPVEWLVTPDLDTDYDWMWAVDLDLLVVSSVRTPAEPLRALVAALRRHRPRNVRLWIDEPRIGYDLWFRPTIESVVGPPDKWVWVMESTRFLPCEEDAIKQSLYLTQGGFQA